MTTQQKVLDLLKYYQGDKMLLAIKLKCSTKTIDRIVGYTDYGEKLQEIRKDRVNMLHTRNCSNNQK